MRKTAIAIAALALWLTAAIAPAHALIGQSPLIPSLNTVDMYGYPGSTDDVREDPVTVWRREVVLVKPAR